MADDDRTIHSIDGSDGSDELMIEEGDDEEVEAQNEQLEALQKAAAEIELVVLPLSCTNEGKGAPLSMGVQRWLAQELARTGLKAAAPVFTAMAEQQGRKIPALMIYRDAWSDRRALQGASRFPNAKRVITADFHVSEEKLALTMRLSDVFFEDAADDSTPAEPEVKAEGEGEGDGDG